jgi:hypothetical protein
MLAPNNRTCPTKATELKGRLGWRILDLQIVLEAGGIALFISKVTQM